jgi:hypothetical protein
LHSALLARARVDASKAFPGNAFGKTRRPRVWGMFNTLDFEKNPRASRLSERVT